MEIKKINKSYSRLSREEKDYIIALYYERKDLKYTELQKLLGVSQRLLKTLMKEYNINSRLKNRYTINSDYFTNIETEQQAYILGFICADGFVGSEAYNNIVIQSNDLDIIQKIAEELSYTGEIRKTQKGGFKNSKNGYVINFSNKTMANDLRNLGIRPNKSLEFDKLLEIPTNLQRHFLRGYFDGDGSITHYIKKRKYKEKTYAYDSMVMTIIATPKLIEEIVENFKIQKYSIQDSKTKGLVYLRINADSQIKEIYKLMYDNATIFLSRKKEKWDKFIECL